MELDWHLLKRFSSNKHKDSYARTLAPQKRQIRKSRLFNQKWYRIRINNAFPTPGLREKVTMGTITAIPNSPLHQVVLKRLGYGTGEEEDAEERHQCRPVSDIDSAKKHAPTT